MLSLLIFLVPVLILLSLYSTPHVLVQVPRPSITSTVTHVLHNIAHYVKLIISVVLVVLHLLSLTKALVPAHQLMFNRVHQQSVFAQIVLSNK